MYERILFPTDGSEPASAGFEYALDIAAAHGATVFVLNVADTTQVSVTRIRGEVIDVLEREGERIVKDTATRARERGVSVETEVLQGRPSETIVGYSETTDIDLIVMPTYGRSGVKRLLLGSVTERVVNTSPIPVLTVTPNADREFHYPSRSVLVPTDGSQGAKLALDAGIDFAKASDAELHLLNVVDTASLGIDVRSAVANDELEERANNILDTACESAHEASIEAVSTVVEYGRPFRKILSYIEEHDIDVVVLGTHGETDFSRYALGGVSAKLIRTSPVPVLMTRGPASDDSATAG